MFDENLHIGNQVDTECSFKNEIIKDLQHLVKGKEIKHFIVADDEIISNKLKEEPKIGHWIVDRSVDCYLDEVRCHCSECGKKKVFPADYDHIKQELSISYKYPEVIDNFCPNCGAKMVEPQEGEKINCKTTKCENCQNHNYCDYEPQESEEKPKSECEHDHEILKAYSDGANAVLDNVRAEIESKYESIPETFHHYETGFTDALEWVLSIIDKYKAEGSDEK